MLLRESFSPLQCAFRYPHSLYELSDAICNTHWESTIDLPLANTGLDLGYQKSTIPYPHVQ